MDLKSVIHNIGAFTKEAILIADADLSDGAVLTFRWVNPAFTEITLYEPEDVYGKTAGILAGDKSDPITHAEIIDKLMAWQSFTMDMEVHRKDKSAFWAQLSFQPLADAEGVFRYWIGLIIDISHRKEIEDTLRDLSLIAQTTEDMVTVLDAERRVTWVNQSFVSATGYGLEDVRGRQLREFLLADTADAEAVGMLVRQLDAGQAGHAELLSRRKDGTRFLGQYEYQPVYNERGVLTRFVTLSRDITERRTLEQRYKAVFDETNAAISILSDGRYLMVNSQYAALHGQSAEWFVGQRAEEVRGDEDQTTQRNVEAHVNATGEAVLWERDLRQEDGTERHFLTKTFRSFDPVLDTHLLCEVATDITDIRKTEKMLRETQRSARNAQKRLWGALDAVPDGFVLYDARDRIVMYNQAFRALHEGLGDALEPGVTFTELMEMGLAAGIWNTDGAPGAEWLARQLAERDGAMRQGVAVALASGRWILCKEVRLENGERAGLRVDITDVKSKEEALRAAQSAAEQAQARLVAAVNALDDSFTIFDAEDRVVINNARRVDLTRTGESNIHDGMTFEEILDIGLAKGIFADAIGREAAWKEERLSAHRNPGEPIEQRFSDGRIFRVIERRTLHNDTVSLRVDLTQLREQQQRLEAYAGELRASHKLVEERNVALERAHVELEHASLHDALTGLANRRYLDRELIRRAEEGRATGAHLAVLHIDLDRFKQINDAFGHDAGDTVLTHVADVLRAAIREGDFAARVGGDEFVILSGAARDEAALGRFAARIIERLRVPVRYEGNECRFGASIGIALAASAEADPKQLLINADIALYRAKTSGRNRWAFFTDALQAEVVSAKRLSDELWRALDRDEFETVYQPQFRAGDMSLAGVEALLRWAHPERGLLEPTDFMAVAEELNLIRQIDGIVLRQVMEDDALWREAGALVPRVSVNVSGRRLRDPELVGDIKRGGIDPSRLSIELLESIFVDDEDDVLAWNIDQLKEMGIEIELDDFGTGHSSLVGLIKFKPSRLKIDRQFVEQSLMADENASLIRSIIQIGHSLDVAVVAEGVETADQVALMRELGCDILQGYALAAPMNAGALRDFVLGRRGRGRPASGG